MLPMIRPAALSDANSINALSAHLGYADVPSGITGERLKRLINSSTDWVWVFEDGYKILGWIHVFTANRLASASFNEIGGLVVDPGARNKGVGRQLVEFAARKSAERSLELRLRCNIKRLEACQFYEGMGFSKSKSQHVFKMSW